MMILLNMRTVQSTMSSKTLYLHTQWMIRNVDANQQLKIICYIYIIRLKDERYTYDLEFIQTSNRTLEPFISNHFNLICVTFPMVMLFYFKISQFPYHAIIYILINLLTNSINRLVLTELLTQLIYISQNQLCLVPLTLNISDNLSSLYNDDIDNDALLYTHEDIYDSLTTSHPLLFCKATVFGTELPEEFYDSTYSQPSYSHIEPPESPKQELVEDNQLLSHNISDNNIVPFTTLSVLPNVTEHALSQSTITDTRRDHRCKIKNVGIPKALSSNSFLEMTHNTFQHTLPMNCIALEESSLANKESHKSDTTDEFSINSSICSSGIGLSSARRLSRRVRNTALSISDTGQHLDDLSGRTSCTSNTPMTSQSIPYENENQLEVNNGLSVQRDDTVDGFSHHESHNGHLVTVTNSSAARVYTNIRASTQWRTVPNTMTAHTVLHHDSYNLNNSNFTSTTSNNRIDNHVNSKNHLKVDGFTGTEKLNNFKVYSLSILLQYRMVDSSKKQSLFSLWPSTSRTAYLEVYEGVSNQLPLKKFQIPKKVNYICGSSQHSGNNEYRRPPPPPQRSLLRNHYTDYQRCILFLRYSATNRPLQSSFQPRTDRNVNVTITRNQVHLPCNELVKSEKIKPKRLALKSGENREATIRRQTKSLLNKMTIELFEKVSCQLGNFLSKSEHAGDIKLCADELFTKATSEPNFCDMYADLVIVMFAQSPNIIITTSSDGIINESRLSSNDLVEYLDNSEKMDPSDIPPNEVIGFEFQVVNFRREFLNRCQDEFKELIEHNALGVPRPSDIDEDDFKTEINRRKRRVLGNIRFIGELYKRRLVKLRTAKEVIQDLLQDTSPHEHFVDCACELLTTIGYSMDKNQQATPLLDEFLSKLETLRQKDLYSSRLSFRIQDLIDLRAQQWRGKLKEEKASTLTELHQKIADEAAQGGAIIMAQKGRFETVGQTTRQAYDGYLEPFRKIVKILSRTTAKIVVQAAGLNTTSSFIVTEPILEITKSQDDVSLVNEKPQQLLALSPQNYNNATPTDSTTKQQVNLPSITVLPTIAVQTKLLNESDIIKPILLDGRLISAVNSSPLGRSRAVSLDSHELLFIMLESTDKLSDFIIHFEKLHQTPLIAAAQFHALVDRFSREIGNKAHFYTTILLELYNKQLIPLMSAVTTFLLHLNKLGETTLINPNAPERFGRLIGLLISNYLAVLWNKHIKLSPIDIVLNEPAFYKLIHELRLPNNHEIKTKFSLAMFHCCDEYPLSFQTITSQLWVSSKCFAFAMMSYKELSNKDIKEENEEEEWMIIADILKVDQTLKQNNPMPNITIYHIVSYSTMLNLSDIDSYMKRIQIGLKVFQLNDVPDTFIKTCLTEILLIERLTEQSISFHPLLYTIPYAVLKIVASTLQELNESSDGHPVLKAIINHHALEELHDHCL